MSRIDALQITPVEASPVLTPQHKRFNSLIRQIEQARRTLATWHDSIPVHGQAYTKVLLPLQTAFMAARRDWAFALDAQLTQRRRVMAERETLRTLRHWVLLTDVADGRRRGLTCQEVALELTQWHAGGSGRVGHRASAQLLPAASSSPWSRGATRRARSAR
jgi:hypothetical protein